MAQDVTRPRSAADDALQAQRASRSHVLLARNSPNWPSWRRIGELNHARAPVRIVLKAMRMRSLLALLFLLMYSACASTYSPVSPVAPLLDRAGAVAVGGNVRPLYPHRGATAYVAAAPTEATRVYVAGSFARMTGNDELGWSRRGDEHNRTNQMEAGAGWGTHRKKFGSYKSMIAEVLLGGGYGYTDAAQCASRDLEGYCSLKLDFSSHFAKALLQGQVARKWMHNLLGAGLKIAVLRYEIERLDGASALGDEWATTIEPFVVGRVGKDWGQLEAGLRLPFVPWSTHVTRTNTDYVVSGGRPEVESGALVSSLKPRISIGVRTDLSSLWR